MLRDSSPEWVGTKLAPGTKGHFLLANQLAVQIDEIMKDPSTLESSPYETMFHHMVANSKKNKAGLPQLNKKWLLQECLNLRFAGSETIGNTTTVGTFHVLRNEHIKRTLMKELEEAWPDVNVPFSFERLEKLPYLVSLFCHSVGPLLTIVICIS